MSSRLVQALLSLTATAALAVAQTPGAATEAGNRSPRTGVTTYSESVSRDLFSACDADSDDRLDVFEASDSLDAVREPKDTAGFQRLDTDRDGFLSWPEFDRHFWNVVQRGSSFHVRPCRSLAEPAPERQEARPASPLQVFLRLHDKNGNGGLDPDELDQMVRTTNLPPSLGSELRKLDQDQSGRVDEAELAPAFELLRPFVSGTAAPAAASGTLAPPWQTADVDGSGHIDLDEFTNMLRRLDPTLTRWAPALLRALDRDGDGSLTATELPQPARPVRHGTAMNRTRPAPTRLPANALTQAANEAPGSPASDR